MGVRLCRGAQLSPVLSGVQDGTAYTISSNMRTCHHTAHRMLAGCFFVLLPCQVSWNLNGTWVASCSRDFTVKVWDVRHSKREMVSWQGHQGGKDITAVAWHPIHLDLLASSKWQLLHGGATRRGRKTDACLLCVWDASCIQCTVCGVLTSVASSKLVKLGVSC
jgi:WD40 repeat protein